MFDKSYKTQVIDINVLNQMQQNDENKLIIDTEKAYQEQIEFIAKDITKNDKIKAVLIAGPSSAGKTTTSKLLIQNFNNLGKTALLVSLDDFFIDRDKTPKLADGNYDYENIKSLDIECFNKFLKDLIENNYAFMPVYDFITGKRKKEYIPVQIDNNTIVIFEGIHALNPTLINIHQDVIKKVYICNNSIYLFNNNEILPKEVRLMRRLYRDYHTRGHSISVTMSMWKNILDGEITYIDPYKDLADYKINSSHIYEVLVLAKYLTLLISQSDNETLLKLTEFLSQCNHIDKIAVPKNSLLQEFLPVSSF